MILYSIYEGPCSKAEPCIQWTMDLGFRPMQMAQVAGGNIIMIKGNDDPLGKYDGALVKKDVVPLDLSPQDSTESDGIYSFTTTTSTSTPPDYIDMPPMAPVPILGSGALMLVPILALILRKLL